MPSSTEWAYFLSGAILPTVAYNYYYCHVVLLRYKTKDSSSSPAASSTSSGSGSGSRSLPPPGDAGDRVLDTGAPQQQSAVAAVATTTAPNQNDDEEDETDSDEEEEEDATNPSPAVELPCASWNLRHAPYKMMLIVNQELGMGKGKIAAQCGHAAVGCYQRALKQCPNALRAWNRTGCAKIAVKCPTTHDLETLAQVAHSLGIPHYLVEDAGRTQIAAGSRTVLGLFGPAFVFESVTDHLKLM